MKTIKVLFAALIITIFSFGASAQTVTDNSYIFNSGVKIKKVISNKYDYKTLTEIPNGDTTYYFFYQNPKYSSIVDMKSFSFKNIDSALAYVDEAIKLFDIQITNDQTIEHKVAGVGMKRRIITSPVGVSDKVYINNEYSVSKDRLIEIRKALIDHKSKM